jgi:hypothetical protein
VLLIYDAVASDDAKANLSMLSGLLDPVFQAAKLVKDNKELQEQALLNEAKIKSLQDDIKALRKDYVKLKQNTVNLATDFLTWGM